MKINMHLTSVFQHIKVFLLLGLIFVFPLFFLPLTQEYYVTAKLYLTAFVATALIVITAIEFALSRKIVWVRGAFDSIVILFLFTVGLSIILSSPNKVQALVSPNLGLIAILSFTILYFYISHHVSKTSRSFVSSAMNVLSISAFIIALVTIIFALNPLKSAALPAALQYLKNSAFNPLGTAFDVALFLGFFIVVQLARIISQRSEGSSKHDVRALFPALLSLFVLIAAFLIVVVPIVRGTTPLILPPLSVSWYAAVEILKNPITALFGVGVDNFGAIFTRAKDTFYNQSPLWQVSSFNVSRSGLLHILTEVGIFGLVAFMLLAVALIREVLAKGEKHGNVLKYLLPVGYVLAAIVFFPPTPIMFFLLFVMMGLMSYMDETESHQYSQATTADVSRLIPVYLGLLVVAIVTVGSSVYFLSRSYVAEYSFKKAIDGAATNNLQSLYENQRQAIIMNPYIERYRLNFAQTNLLIANNLAQRAQQATQGQQNQQNAQQQQPQLSEQDRQTITQAIQAAINEAKAAVTLNPQKASNWENLANIYRNVLNVVQEADVWTVSSYQRAIVLDPQNPIYRISLGGVYYSVGAYDDASKLFEQAVGLKPDWSNAHYNLAWSSYQKKDYQRAVAEMQSVLSLINPKKDEADFKKASSELDEFKKMLPKEEKQATGEAAQSQQLGIPTPPVATVEPKLQLPEGASPEQ